MRWSNNYVHHFNYTRGGFLVEGGGRRVFKTNTHDYSNLSFCSSLLADNEWVEFNAPPDTTYVISEAEE